MWRQNKVIYIQKTRLIPVIHTNHCFPFDKIFCLCVCTFITFLRTCPCLHYCLHQWMLEMFYFIKFSLSENHFDWNNEIIPQLSYFFFFWHSVLPILDFLYNVLWISTETPVLQTKPMAYFFSSYIIDFLSSNTSHSTFSYLSRLSKCSGICIYTHKVHLWFFFIMQQKEIIIPVN